MIIHPLTPLRRPSRWLGLKTPLEPLNRLYTDGATRANKNRLDLLVQPHAKKGARISHAISTLNPDRITPSDYLDVSSRCLLTVHFPGSSGRGTGLRFHHIGITPQPFPENTAGFLYYHKHPRAAPMEGSIRLRVTRNNSPSSFSRGQDLCLPSGFSWQTILPQIAVHSDLTDIRIQLLRENLVTPEQLSQCSRVFGGSTQAPTYRTLVRIDQEFQLGFSYRPTLTVAGQKLHRLRFPFFQAQVDGRKIFPWTGSANVRFEPSPLPGADGGRVLHLRIVKLLMPVSSTVKGYRGRISRPEEGQLFTISRHNGPPEPWRCNVDHDTSPVAVALRDLWDCSPSPSTPESQSVT
ncbi:hypothetical protein C8R47DRAFT_288910 [Mycena vitilis]|nr:hypothetical protein C8R47DRAFT_288910 [Mycena vitilis]